MSDLEKIVFIYYLIGDSKTGKKSILNRFKILNSTNTIIDEDRSFKKFYTISKYNFELKFHKIVNPDQIQFNDNPNEDDENVKNHKLNFTNVIKQIKGIKSLIDPRETVKEIFLFCFDLSNHHSLEKLKIFYEELSLIFQFDQTYKVLIGNKLDKKEALSNEDAEILNFFCSKKIDENLILNQNNINKLLVDNMPYYEISTKNFFNFERFYEKLFFDLFEKTDPDFQTNYFKDMFKNIMNFKPTFSKSERTVFQSNNVPGPQKYPANVYDLGNEKMLNNEQERTKMLSDFFRGKNRYNNKIFVNKKGPVFSNKKGADFHRKHNIEKMDDNEVNKPQTATAFPQEYYQKLYNNFSGFTFGIKTHNKIKLREERKEEFEKLQYSYDEAFGTVHNITSRQFFFKNSGSIDKKSRTTVKLMFDSDKKKPKIFKVLSKEELMKKQEEEILSKIKNKEYIKPLKQINRKSYFFDEEKRKRYGPEPGPGSFEVAGSIQQNKGYTFGTKSNLTETLIKTAPAYVLLPSDFENIEEHATFSQAERFPKIKKQYEAMQRADEEIEKISDKIEEKIKKANMMRKDNIKNLLEKLEKEKKFIKRVDKSDNEVPGPGTYDIKYNYAEEKLPFYSLGGRLEKPHQSTPAQYEDSNKVYNLEQSFSMLNKNTANSMNPLPNYNTVKPSIPGLLFGSSERFTNLKESMRPGHTFYNKFDTVEINNDKNKVLYFGKSDRFKEFQKTFFQGPELYRITGFAENLVKKNEKASELKGRKLKSLNLNSKNITMDNFTSNLNKMISDTMKEEEEL